MVSQNEFPSDEEQLLDKAIADFLQADPARQARSRQEWLDLFPACAAGLLEFFDDRDRVDLLVRPVPTDPRASSSGCDPTQLLVSPGRASEAKQVDDGPKPPQFATARYRPLRFHARGGMGEVWLAEDVRIGRKVALKKLRTGRDEKLARFQLEAQVTGQLEHPSVVPLHDVGLDDDGQPFYVMKFIQGRNLREAIADFHGHKASAEWPGDRQFLRLLENFISVCNAVAYAHSKGVLHRDIKPDNVMLGRYGETLVLDWGLAKFIGQPEEQSASGVQLSGGTSTATRAGAIVGSPLYMSPEGAEGRTDAIDQSSDVYLLGATLYEILTAKPPRHGSSQWELINLARNTLPVAPRKLDPSIPRALDAICLKAMAFHKHDRYDSPLALAEDIQRFLAGEPTAAYREPLLTRIGRWIRRHRRIIVRSFALLSAVILAGFALHNYRQARLFAKREQSRGQLVEFYRLADEAQFFAANTDAVSERAPYYDPKLALSVGEMALAIAAPWGEQAQDLPLPDERAKLMNAQYALLSQMARVNLQEHHPSTAGLHRALALLNQARSIQSPSRGDYQLRSRCLTLLEEFPAAKRDADRANWQETPVSADDHFLQGELLRGEDTGASARVIDDQGTLHREHLAKAVEEYRVALEQDPRHFWARFQLGRCLLALGRRPEAVEALSACIALRPTSPWAYTTRGLANALSGHTQEALVDLDRAVQLDPSFQPARLNRGVAHWLQACTANVADDFNAALADFDAVLAAPANQRLIEAGYYRGQILLKKQRNREALANFSEVIDARPNFRAAYWFRAQVQFRLDHSAEGQSDLTKFLALTESQPSQNIKTRTHVPLGKALRLLAQELDGDAQRQALRLAADQLQSAIVADPPTAEAYRHLGAVRELQGKMPEAIDAYSEGLSVAADSIPLRNLRGWLYSKNEHDLARADFAEAVRLAPENSESHTGLGYVLALAGANDAAQSEIAAALLSGADDYLVLHNVACIYAQLSQSEPNRRLEHENSALAALQRAVTLYRKSSVVSGADEIELIRLEEAFPNSMRSRPDFQHLLTRENL